MERCFDVLEIRTSANGPGVVARCRWHAAGGREVAVRPVPDDPQLHEQLVDQVQRQRQLAHPGVVPLEHLLDLGDRAALISEWVEGVALDVLAEHRPLGTAAIVTLVRRAARCLEAVHRATDSDGQSLHLVHGSPGPTELMLTATGALKVVDLGRVVGRQPVSDLSVPGQLRWRAPERVDHTLTLGPSVDVYGLGLTTFQLCAGMPLVLAARPAAHEQALRRQLEALGRRLGPGWEDLVALLGEMLAWFPQERPTAAAVVARLSLLTEGVDVAVLAETRVAPLLAHRQRLAPPRHPEWSEVAFLQAPVASELAELHDEPSGATRAADVAVRRFLTQSEWTERTGALQYLLATHPAWSAAPFLDLLHLSRLQADRPTPEELVAALRVLQHRCTDDVRDAVRRLVDHPHPAVREAAAALLGPGARARTRHSA